MDLRKSNTKTKFKILSSSNFISLITFLIQLSRNTITNNIYAFRFWIIQLIFCFFVLIFNK